MPCCIAELPVRGVSESLRLVVQERHPDKVFCDSSVRAFRMKLSLCRLQIRPAKEREKVISS